MNEVKLDYSKEINEKELKNRKKRKIKDFLFNGTTYTMSFLCVLILFSVIFYVFSNGIEYFSIDLFTSNYNQVSYTLKNKDDFTLIDDLNYPDLKYEEDTSYSYVWGVGLKEKEDVNKNTVVYISEISSNSPFNELIDVSTNSIFKIDESVYLETITFLTSEGTYKSAFGSEGKEAVVEVMEKGIKIVDSNFKTYGGGIRGSLLNTLMLILITVLIAMPIGIGGAIYLGFYAKNNKLTRILRSLIDMVSGIPSIIFGLVGAAIFIPLFSSNGGNVFTGSLTLTLILLPTIIKTVEESIKTIPKERINASLALGASEKQTVFKIILPGSIEGILNSLILSIGRIIGESAALVFAMGTIIGDNLSFTSGNTSLAVHIWVILGGEYPHYNEACAISILILIIVFILSILSKLVSYVYKRKKAR